MFVGLLMFFGGLGLAERPAEVLEHVIVYKEEGRFAGWPANHGMWAWGEELVVGFEVGYFRETDRGHAIDYGRPGEHVLARSLNGGQTWALEKPNGLKPPPGIKVAGVPAPPGGAEPADFDGEMDFTHPGFALTARMASIHTGPSRFYYTLDKGKSWKGPYHLPDFGQPGIAARTDYLIDGPRELTVFLTAAKFNGREGRVICVRTRDGGKNWERVSDVTPEPEGRGYAIMPSSVRLSATEILTAVRRRGWIESYRSQDNASSWSYEQEVSRTGRGNPPALIRLRDGRLVLSYGYRAEPYGIRARISSDQGRTWEKEIILREDGGNWDLGYPRTVERPDGKLVTVYYFNDHADRERYIAATIWDPGVSP
ncbi:MAG: sialidase family protein [Acidobacteriota bacterium]